MSRLDGPLSALRRLSRRQAAPGAVVLGYHDVVAEDADVSGMTVSRRQLERHLDVLDELGLELVSSTELVDAIEAGRPIDRLAVITFDDALLGVADHAAAVLAERRVTATVFVVTDHLGVDPPWWPGMPRTLDADELAALHAAGHVLASHTVSHASLPSLGEAQMADELGRSRELLEKLTGDRVDMLAYPSGHHAPDVRRQARAAGYRAAFTFLNGRIVGGEDLLALPRLTMGTHMTPTRLRYHLLRSAASWPDHQLDAVGPSNR